MDTRMMVFTDRDLVLHLFILLVAGDMMLVSLQVIAPRYYASLTF
jgi:hypothetical protein